MNSQQLRDYNKSQRQEILNFKWTESEKAGHDLYPGHWGENQAAYDWIEKYAISYREYWNRKQC